MKRRTAIEPVIGHIKNEHRMGRNYLAGTKGDAINAVLAAALASPHLFEAFVASDSRRLGCSDTSTRYRRRAKSGLFTVDLFT
jgi:hypothetical protein